MTYGLSRGRVLVTDGVGLDGAALPPPPATDAPESERLDPRQWFDEPSNPFEIEIGSGKGTFLLQQGALLPRVNYLGIEWSNEFFRYAADRVRRHGLSNVRLLRADGTEFLRHWCASGMARVIHLYFSDPWPKKRHHKRRVVQDATLADFHRILIPGGELRLVTDHDDLWAWCEEHARRQSRLFDRRDFAAPESASAGELVGSNFERKYRREARPFHAMTLLARLGPAHSSVARLGSASRG